MFRKEIIYKGNLTILFCIILCCVCVGFFNRGSSPYNQNPNLSRKVVGSERDTYYMAPLKSFDTVVFFSDLIIKGHVVGEPIQDQKTIEYALISSKNGHLPEIPVSLVKVNIDEVFKGDITENEIILLQEGIVGDDESLETKVKNDGEYIFFLLKSEFKGNDIYIAYRKEVGIMKVEKASKNNITTYSLSREPLLTRYDDIDIKILLNDISTSLNRTKNISVKDAYELYYDMSLDVAE